MRKQTTGMLNLTNTTGDNLNQRDHHDKGITPIIDAAWWFGTFFLFSHILGIVTPADELIFFRGVGQPPTSNDKFPFEVNCRLMPFRGNKKMQITPDRLSYQEFSC